MAVRPAVLDETNALFAARRCLSRAIGSNDPCSVTVPSTRVLTALRVHHYCHKVDLNQLGLPASSENVPMTPHSMPDTPTPPINWSVYTLPLLKDLDRSAMTRLLAGISTIDAPRGTVLFQRGDTCMGFHMVVLGLVELCLQKPGCDEKVVALVSRGESFGEPELFLDQPYRVRARSLVDSKLIHLAKKTVLAELEHSSQFAHRIITTLSSRLNQYIDDVEAYSLCSGTERLISYLLKLLPENAAIGANTVTLPAQKRVIASHLNLTHEHFSRVLHELMAAGLIDVRGRIVRILDAQQLRTYGS